MVESKSTLADIAKLVKVSVKTASRVVRQEPNVSSKTRAAVEKAIKVSAQCSAEGCSGHTLLLTGTDIRQPQP